MTQPAEGAVRVAAADMGAGSGRVIVAELRDGRITLAEVHRFESPQFHDAATGYDAWDVDLIVSHIREGLEKAEATGPIASVGCDTWGVDYVLLDKDLQRVGPAVAYRDDRTSGMIEALCARMPAEEIYRRTGIQFQPYNSIYQLAATTKEHPEWLERAEHLLFMPDYLHFALSGAMANDYTMATTSQMISLATGDWDPDLLELAGVPARLLRKPTPPGTILGEHRLANGRTIKVVTPAGHDTAAAVAAAPLSGPNEAYLVSGTWSLMGLDSAVPFADARAFGYNFTNEGGVNGHFRVLKNIMGLWLIQRARKELGAPAFADLVAAASAAPGWASLIHPDDPRFLNPANMVETIQAVAAEHGEPVPEGLGPIARCIFDSLALDYARTKGELETLRGRPLEVIRIIGGGSQNALLNQLTADACGIPVTSGPVETSALGNACLQMMALGAIGSLDEARQIVRTSFPLTEFRPSAAVPDAVRIRYDRLCARSAGH